VAHHKSAKTRIRRNERARIRNKVYLSSVRTAIKKFRSAVAELETGKGSKDEIRGLFNGAKTLIAKAGQKGLTHKNNVSRKISRLSAVMKTIDKGEFKEAAAATHKKKKAKKVVKKTAKKKVAKKKVAKKKVAKKK
jgi:small subunit ribosomal protein S20